MAREKAARAREKAARKREKAEQEQKNAELLRIIEQLQKNPKMPSVEA